MAKKKEELPEEVVFLNDLKSSYYEVENRTKLDRHREFRELFLGSKVGGRVLQEILSLAKLSARLVEPFPAEIDEKRLLVREGARQLAADIINIIHKEPQENKQAKVNRKRPV